ncbi:hypothetical protein KI387_026128, partial [Taxus chinensis]
MARYAQDIPRQVWVRPGKSADIPGRAWPYLNRFQARIRAIPIPSTFRTGN